MRITQGPMLERFASVFDIPVDEVVEWVSAYVNTPETFENQHLIEKTEKERFASIRKYVEMRLADTSDSRIRQFLAVTKQESA